MRQDRGVSGDAQRLEQLGWMLFLKILDEDDGTEYVPVWPRSEFAEAYAAKSGDLIPKSISVPEFFRKWIEGLTRDNLQIGVFPGLDSDIWLTTPSEFRNDLKDAMSDI